jgi:myo-inositol-1(or 4)-monophosphatase
LIATGFSYLRDQRNRQAHLLTHVLPEVRDIRRFGSAAIDLCWVAGGRVNGYYERGVQTWDVAAGSLIATEAGAQLTTLADETVVCTWPGLLEPLVALLESAPALPG